MRNSLPLRCTSLLLCVFGLIAAAIGEEPASVSVCQLKADPAAYNHKLAESATFGIEDMEILESMCHESGDFDQWNFDLLDTEHAAAFPIGSNAATDPWLEYGGTVKSGTMYSAEEPAYKGGVHNRPVRPRAKRRLDGLLEQFKLLVLNQQSKYPGGVYWGGYGHMGCCSLLAIQEVKGVDTEERSDVDYAAEPDQPDIQKAGCGYTFLLPIQRTKELLDWQRETDHGNHQWAFENPRRVASEVLAKLARTDEAQLSDMRLLRENQGRKVYEWRPAAPNARQSYMVVVSRPYLLSFYARDPKRVAWVALAAYRSSCDDDNSVKRLRYRPNTDGSMILGSHPTSLGRDSLTELR